MTKDECCPRPLKEAIPSSHRGVLWTSTRNTMYMERMKDKNKTTSMRNSTISLSFSSPLSLLAYRWIGVKFPHLRNSFIILFFHQGSTRFIKG
jgi:hypothetical protein